LNVGRIGDQMVPNGDFSGPLDTTLLASTTQWWSTTAGSNDSVLDTTSPVGTRALKNSVVNGYAYSPSFSVKELETYALSWTSKHDLAGATPGISYCRVMWRNASDVYFGVTDVAGKSRVHNDLRLGADVWETFEFNVTAPAGAAMARIAVTNHGGSTGALSVAEVTMRSLVGTTNIRDGAITTDKIVANAITAAQIRAGTITGDKLNATTSITVGTHATNKWVIDGTSSATTTAIHTANATSYGDIDGVWLGADGRVSLKDKLTFDGTALSVNGAVDATSFKLIQGADTVFSAYSSDSSFERLRMYTNDSVINENWDIGWSSGDYDEFDTNKLFIKLNAPGNPTSLQISQALGITIATDNNSGDSITQMARGSTASTFASTYVAADQNSMNYNRGSGNFGSFQLNGYGTSKVNASLYANGYVDIEADDGIRFTSPLDMGGFAITNLNELGASDGGSSDPSYTFDSDPDTGTYLYGTNQLGFTAGGSVKLTLGTSQNNMYQNLDMGGNTVTAVGQLQVQKEFTSASPGWASAQAVIESTSVANSIAAVSIRNNQANLASQLRVWGNDGSGIGVVNAAGTAFHPVFASAFTVSSTLRVKQEVAVVEGDSLLERCRHVKAIRFRGKERPESVVMTARFSDLDGRWQARGRKPLKPDSSRDYEIIEHDCCLDHCDGTPDAPCHDILNDGPKMGLAAEELYEIFPEAVRVNGDRVPMGINVDQVASIALAGVAALTARLDEALAKIEALEAR
jgi:hypothetical protein